MMGLSPRAIRVWQRDRDVFLALGKSEMPGLMIEPLLVLLSMGLGLGAYVGDIAGTDYMEFIAPGIIAAYGMFAAAFECTYGSFVRLDYQKTFDAIISTPLGVSDVVAGEILWGASRALLTTTTVLTLAAAFGLVHSPMAVLALPAGFLSGLMFASISLVFTAVAPNVSTFNYFFTMFITPMFYFSGVFFPLSSFNETVRTLSWIAPLTPVARIMRAVVMGDLEWTLFGALAEILAITAVFFFLAQVFMKRRLFR